LDAIKVKAIRYYLCESQVGFGKRIGVAASTISAVENKQRDISDKIRAELIKIESELPEGFFNFYERFKKSI